MRIAVIAPGSMGAAVARRLGDRGADVAMTLEGRGQASAARAAGITLRDSAGGAYRLGGCGAVDRAPGRGARAPAGAGAGGTLGRDLR